MGGCSAVGCSKRSENGFQLFPFPKEPTRRAAWETAVKRLTSVHDSFKSSTPSSSGSSTVVCDRESQRKWPWKSTPGSRLCISHFADDAFEVRREDGKRKLKTSAVPTIFCFRPTKPSRGVRRRAIPPHELEPSKKMCRIQEEHSYYSGKDESAHDDNVPVTDHLYSNDAAGTPNEVTLPIVDQLENSKDGCSRCVKLEKTTVKLRRLLLEKRQNRKKKLGGQFGCNVDLFKRVYTGCQLASLARRSTNFMKWDTNTIKKALQLWFACGASGYNLLIKQHQPLPSVRTLQRRLKSVLFQPGTLDHVFEFMRLKTDTMTAEEKLCCLTLDECAITPSVEYDVNNGSILGDSSFPDRSQKATHALVMMVSGLTTRWKQTVAYHYTGNSVDGQCMQPLVLSVIRKASNIGLHVVCVTSDMGAANRALWKSFGVTSTRHSLSTSISHPCDETRQLYFMADVPHLIKNLRGMFCNHKQITLSPLTVQKHNLNSDTVCVSHIHHLIDYQEGKELLLAPKLMRSFLSPGHFNKMKVGQALQVFSHSVSSGLHEIVDKAGYPVELKTTAWFVEQCNHWFDLMSSRSPVMALSANKPHNNNDAVEFLNNFSEMIASCRFGEQNTWKPVQSGVAMSTRTVVHLSKELLGSGVSFLLTSRLSQDCLENLFGAVRLRNPVPTPLEFKNALKLITISQFLTEKKSGNYMVDHNDHLAEFLSVPPPAQEVDLEQLDEVIICDFSSQSAPPEAELTALYYLAGYCVHSLNVKKQLCAHCYQAALCQEDVVPPEASFTLRKEYKIKALTRCSIPVFELCKHVEVIVRQVEPVVKSLKKPLDSIITNCKDNASISKISLPSCHNLKSKLIQKYSSVRLQLICKKLRSSVTTRSSGAAMGSRSAAMRELVKRV